MKLVCQHNLPENVPYKKVDSFLAELKKRYADKISSTTSYWDLDHTKMFFSVNILNFNIKGMIYLKKGHIVLEADVPFLASMFNRTIKKMVGQQFKALLSNP